MYTRRKYSKEFKEETVRLVNVSGNTSETAYNLESMPGYFTGAVSRPRSEDDERSQANRFGYTGFPQSVFPATLSKLVPRQPTRSDPQGIRRHRKNGA